MNEDSGKKIYNLLKELNALFNKNLREYFTKWNLTAPQILVLSLLHERRELKISEIADNMGLADSNISGIIDRLENSGLVERVRCSNDRRIVRVRLTNSAEDMMEELDVDIEGYFSLLLEKLSKDELCEIIINMERLKDKLSDNAGLK